MPRKIRKRKKAAAKKGAAHKRAVRPPSAKKLAARKAAAEKAAHQDAEKGGKASSTQSSSGQAAGGRASKQAQKQTGKQADRRSSAKRAGAKAGSKTGASRGWSAIRWILAGVIILFSLAAALFYYMFQFTFGDTLTRSSTSPSGRLTFNTREGCLGKVCWHEGEVIVNRGPLATGADIGESCKLGIASGGKPYFDAGYSFGWSRDESVFTWRSEKHGSGKVDLRKDCGRAVSFKSPSRKRTLQVRETCLFSPCQRRLTLLVKSDPASKNAKKLACAFSHPYEKSLFTGLPRHRPKFKWSADESTVSWRVMNPLENGAINLNKACRPE